MEYIYAALMLHKLGKEINEENLKKIIESTGTEADMSKIKSLVVTLKEIDIDKELENAIAVGVAAPSSTEESKPKVEEKKEEKREAAAEGLAALFG